MPNCEDCYKFFEKPQQLKRHMRKEHRKDTSSKRALATYEWDNFRYRGQRRNVVLNGRL